MGGRLVCTGVHFVEAEVTTSTRTPRPRPSHHRACRTLADTAGLTQGVRGELRDRRRPEVHGIQVFGLNHQVRIRHGRPDEPSWTPDSQPRLRIRRSAVASLLPLRPGQEPASAPSPSPRMTRPNPVASTLRPEPMNHSGRQSPDTNAYTSRLRPEAFQTGKSSGNLKWLNVTPTPPSTMTGQTPDSQPKLRIRRSAVASLLPRRSSQEPVSALSPRRDMLE